MSIRQGVGESRGREVGRGREDAMPLHVAQKSELPVALKILVVLLYTRNRRVHLPVNWKNYIASDPEVLRGKPRVKGTRIPVSLVLGYLAAGQSADQIIAEFPDLTRDRIAACLDYARDLSSVTAA